MKKSLIQTNAEKILDALTQEFSVTREEGIRDHLSSEITTARRHIHKQLRRDNPFKNYQYALQRSERELESKNVATIRQLKRDLTAFHELAKRTNTRIDGKFWESEIQKLKESQKFQTNLQALSKKYGSSNRNKKGDDSNKAYEERVVCRRLLLQQWRKLLDEQVAKWEIEIIQEFRQQLLNVLREWLKRLQSLLDALDELSIEPGLLFDLSKDNLSLSNIAQLKRWASYISKDKGVKRLCDMMGRLRRAETAKRQALIKNRLTVTEYIPDVNSREERVGIHFGKDIEHVLPQEIALLADDATATLFDMKFVEGRLMCFEMEGRETSTREIEEEQMREVEEEEELGPIIICVDTSGSMHGSPETVAKAVTLFMATRALSQKRNCLLINFSTGIETLDLSGGVGMTKVITFLQRSFHGGTDSTLALTHALKTIENEKYNQSDLLVISDFIMSSLPEPLHEKILKAKANKNRFYSLSIGDLFLSERLRDVFDNQWVYNPSTSSINSIQEIASSI